MIMSEEILGKAKEPQFKGYEWDYVEIEWYEAYKRIHQKTTEKGRELRIRLGTEILTRGLREGDVLWAEGHEAVAVKILPCEVIIIDVNQDHPYMACKICYEIGNKHAALMWGEGYSQFITPYNEPTFQMLGRLHGVQVRRDKRKLDFDRAISATVSSHTH